MHAYSAWICARSSNTCKRCIAEIGCMSAEIGSGCCNLMEGCLATARIWLLVEACLLPTVSPEPSPQLLAVSLKSFVVKSLKGSRAAGLCTQIIKIHEDQPDWMVADEIDKMKIKDHSDYQDGSRLTRTRSDCQD